MPSLISNTTLRALQTPHDLALYFHHQSQSHAPNIKGITDHLLDSIRRESLPPEIFATFCVAVGESDEAVPLLAGLRQEVSEFVKWAAIKRFGRVLKTSRWKGVWDEVGGSGGLRTLLSEWSVMEVGFMCKAIGWSGKSGEGGGSESEDEKRGCVTELLGALLSNTSSSLKGSCPDAPDEGEEGQDERSLLHLYAALVPACTSEYVREMVLDHGGPFQWDPARVRRIAQCHWPVLQRLVLSTLDSSEKKAGAERGTEMAAQGEAAESLMRCYLPHLLEKVPRLPGNERGFSAVMEFSTEVLRKLAAGAESTFFNGDGFETILIIPLLRRAVERKAKAQSIREIVDLALAYLERHPELCSSSRRFNAYGFPAYVARVWTTEPDTFEPQLIAILKRQSYGKLRTFEAYEGILDVVQREHRYRLLRLVILWSGGVNVDIDDEDGLERFPIQQWPASLFLCLPPTKALDLLRRLMRLKPEGAFLKTPQINARVRLPSIMSRRASSGAGHADPELLLTILSVGDSGAEADGWTSVEKCKQMSSRSKLQSERIFQGYSAAFYAIASGSLTLYSEVIIWLRRYLRDPPSSILYSSNMIRTEEGVALLSGIPNDLSSYTLRDVKERVMEANQVLIDLFGTAVLAMSEPSFQIRDWDYARLLFRHVVEARILETRRLKNSLSSTEEDLYDTLWAPTIDLLLLVERRALQTENEALDFTSPQGLLFQDTQTLKSLLPLFVPPSAFSPAVYRFIDDLAIARDQLWQKHRLTLHSECATLHGNWPRGLPIQCLVGSPFDKFLCHAAKPHTPYISSRASAAVLIQSNPLVDTKDLDKETRNAIGHFVDSYELALRIHVLQQKPGEDQQNHASAALAHVLKMNRKDLLDHSAKPRMSESEALRFWKRIFERALPSVKLRVFSELKQQDSRGYPILPSTPDGRGMRERLEWNPNEAKPPTVEARIIPATHLECMILASPSGKYKNLLISTLYTPTFQPPGIWSGEKLSQIQRESETVKDGTLVSALLFQAFKMRPKTNVLASAFPSEQDMRYPPLFLDQDFLESTKDDDEVIRQALYRLRRRVPPTLLQRLVKDAFSAINDEKVGGSERSVGEQTAFRLLKLLSRCDRPQIAANAILRTIIDRPESSSWHRFILTKNFLRRLSKTQAQEFVRDFESSLHSKLDEQTTIRVELQKRAVPLIESASQPLPEPLIKVTTLKFFAQLLDDTDAIPNKDSIQMLPKLLQRMDHIDARISIIESLLSKMCACKDTSKLEEQVLESLERTIPVMGGVSERQQLNEEDWLRFGNSAILPEVSYDGSIKGVPPILGTMYSAFHHGRSGELSVHKRTQILNRVILPAVLNTKHTNARWVQLYMRKYSSNLQHHSLTIDVPPKPNLIALLLDAAVSQLPSWVLEDYQSHILINIQPPSWLESLNDESLSDPERRDYPYDRNWPWNAVRCPNSGEHWRSLFRQGPNAVFAADFTLAQILSRPWKPSSMPNHEEGIQLAQVQKYVLEQASALSRLRDPGFTHWTRFIKQLYPPQRSSSASPDQDEKIAAWLSNTKPILARIVADLDRQRLSPEHIFLPPTFPLHLQLLDYPHLFPDQSNALEHFTAQLLHHLLETHDLGLAYHHRLEEIIEAALQLTNKQRVRFACLIGDLSHDRITIAGRRGEDAVTGRGKSILRAEVADRVLSKVGIEVGDDDERFMVGRMLKGWVGCADEEVRIRGVRTGRRVRLNVES